MSQRLQLGCRDLEGLFFQELGVRLDGLWVWDCSELRYSMHAL